MKPSPGRLLRSFAALPSITFALLVFLIVLSVYIPTILPGPVGGDAGEFQYVGPLFTLSHTTGYPLYISIGWLWSRLVPIGSIPYRMNLLSAVSAAATAAVLTVWLIRLIGSRFIAVASGLILAFGNSLWIEAVEAEKYAFNALLMTLVVGLALEWITRIDERDSDRRLYLLSAAYGVSLLHHRSMLVFGLPLALLVATQLRAGLWKQPRRTIIAALLVLGPPLLVYPILLPILRSRSALTIVFWKPANLQEWMTWLQDRGAVNDVFREQGIGEQLSLYVHILLGDYTIIPVLLAVVGLIALAMRRRAAAFFLAFSYVLQAGLSANYRGFAVPAKFYLPSFVVLLYAAGYGLHAIWVTLRERLPQRWQMPAGVTLACLIMIVPLIQVTRHYPERRLAATYGDPLDSFRQAIRTDDMGRRLASGLAFLPPDSVLICDWEQATVFWTVQQFDGLRPDVEIIYPIHRLPDFVEDPRPLALARTLPLDESWHPTSAGSLVLLQREPSFELPDTMTPLDVDLFTQAGEAQLRLAGQIGAQPAYQSGHHYPLVLVWQALAEMQTDYSISLHILDENWNQIWGRDLASPVLGMYATSRWEPGEVVQDYHELSIVPDFPAGRYLWTVVVYHQKDDGTFEGLVDTSGSSEILGGTFEIQNP